MRKLILLAVLFSLLFFGCLSITGTQVVEKDGSSTVTYKIDFSDYMTSGYTDPNYYFDASIEPNDNFDLTDYDLYADASDKGLIIELHDYNNYYTSGIYERGSSDVTLEIEVKNENQYEDLELEAVDSYAFVDLSFYINWNYDTYSSYDPSLVPNHEFDVDDYNNMTSASSIGMNVDLGSYVDTETPAGSPYIYLDVVVEDGNNYDDLELEAVDSYAFVDINFYGEGYGGYYSDDLTFYVYAATANVEPGLYPVVYTFSYTENGQTKTVKHIEYIEVVENEYAAEPLVYYVGGSVANVAENSYPVVYLFSYTNAQGNKEYAKEIMYFDVVENAYEYTEPETDQEKMDAFIQKGEENCDDILDKYPDAECEFKNYKFEVSRKVTPDEGDYTFKSEYEFPFYTVYTIEMEKLPRLFDEDDDLLVDDLTIWGDFEDGGDSDLLTNVEGTHTITMPGEEIIDKGEGKIVKNTMKVSFNIINLFKDKEPMIVKSREMNLIVVGLLAVGLLILVVLVAFFAIKMLNRPKPL